MIKYNNHISLRSNREQMDTETCSDTAWKAEILASGLVNLCVEARGQILGTGSLHHVGPLGTELKVICLAVSAFTLLGHLTDPITYIRADSRDFQKQKANTRKGPCKESFLHCVLHDQCPTHHCIQNLFVEGLDLANSAPWLVSGKVFLTRVYPKSWDKGGRSCSVLNGLKSINLDYE